MKKAELNNNMKIEQYLADLSEEYKVLLFNALLEESPSVDELSVSELLRLDSEIKRPLLPAYRRYQRRRRRLLFIGFTYVLVGLFCFVFYLLYKQFRFSTFDKDSIISLVCSVTVLLGLAISVLSFFIPQRIKEEMSMPNTKHINESSALLEYEIISKWRAVEGLVSDFSMNSNVVTASSAISFLKQNGMIDASEQETLKKLLKLRNEIVHTKKRSVSINEAQDLLKESDKIINKLKMVLQ